MIINSTKKVFGETGEEMAIAFLKEKGYRIVEKNYRTPFGEIDIIAHDGPILVFLEVKARRNPTFATPLLAVNRRKQQHIVKSAMSYLFSKRIKDKGCRFDVVAITISDDVNPVRDLSLNGVKIELFKNAFELERDFR